MTVQFETMRTSEWADLNPVLRKGEPGYDWIKNKLKMGDGVTAWNDLPYFSDSELWFAPNTHFLDLSTDGSVRLGYAAVKRADKNVGFVIPPVPLTSNASLTISHGWAANAGDKSGILIMAVSKMADAAGVPTFPTEPGMAGGYLFLTVDADGNRVFPATAVPTGWTLNEEAGTSGGGSFSLGLTTPAVAGYYAIELSFVGN